MRKLAFVVFLSATLVMTEQAQAEPIRINVHYHGDYWHCYRCTHVDLGDGTDAIVCEPAIGMGFMCLFD